MVIYYHHHIFHTLSLFNHHNNDDIHFLSNNNLFNIMSIYQMYKYHNIMDMQINIDYYNKNHLLNNLQNYHITPIQLLFDLHTCFHKYILLHSNTIHININNNFLLYKLCTLSNILFNNIYQHSMFQLHLYNQKHILEIPLHILINNSNKLL